MSSSSADRIIKQCHDVDELLQSDNSKNPTTTTTNHHTNVDNKPVHYLHELPLAAEKRYELLFNQLDRNGNELTITTFCTVNNSVEQIEMCAT